MIDVTEEVGSLNLDPLIISIARDYAPCTEA